MNKKVSESLASVRLICANPECGNRFTPTTVRQEYCCRKCRERVNHKLAYTRMKEEREKTLIQCAWCGKKFVYRNGAKYCCEECRLAANGRKRSGYSARRNRGHKPKLSLSKAAMVARKDGLSYGKYMERNNYFGWFDR